MKRYLTVIMVFALLFSLTACSSGTKEGDRSPSGSLDAEEPVQITDSETENTGDSVSEEDQADMQTEGSEGHALVVYFSRSGNTKQVAEASTAMIFREKR